MPVPSPMTMLSCYIASVLAVLLTFAAASAQQPPVVHLLIHVDDTAPAGR